MLPDGRETLLANLWMYLEECHSVFPGQEWSGEAEPIAAIAGKAALGHAALNSPDSVKPWPMPGLQGDGRKQAETEALNLQLRHRPCFIECCGRWFPRDVVVLPDPGFLFQGPEGPCHSLPPGPWEHPPRRFPAPDAGSPGGPASSGF